MEEDSLFWQSNHLFTNTYYTTTSSSSLLASKWDWIGHPHAVAQHWTAVVIVIGTIQSLLSKTSKYALFDPTTQLSYITFHSTRPTQDSKVNVKGKAAIDDMGSRIGKCGGRILHPATVNKTHYPFPFSLCLHSPTVVSTRLWVWKHYQCGTGRGYHFLRHSVCVVERGPKRLRKNKI